MNEENKSVVGINEVIVYEERKLYVVSVLNNSVMAEYLEGTCENGYNRTVIRHGKYRKIGEKVKNIVK